MADAAATTTKTTKSRTPKASAGTKASVKRSNKDEAKSRFSAALDEAKAGAAALTAEARERGSGYTSQARSRGDDYAAQAKTKASELARDGKAKAAGALTSLGKAVADNADALDEKLGSKYGDYARSASRSLQDTATKLENKSVEELTEDTRQMIRRNPGTAVGIAAVTGFILSRIFRK